MTTRPELRSRIEDLVTEVGQRVQRLRLSDVAPVDLWIEVDGDARTATLIVGPLEAAGPLPSLSSGDLVTTAITEDHGRTTVHIRLLDLDFLDVFIRLLEDLTVTAEAIHGAPQALRAILSRLQTWNRLFASTRQGLTLAQQKGLLGELSVLAALIGPFAGPVDAVSSWIGPLGSVRDFERTTIGIEVKTTSGAPPYSVNISSERQLDYKAVSSLFLWVIVLQEAPIGRTLNDWVDEVRRLCAIDVFATDILEERLAKAGYIDLQRALYTSSFELVDSQTFRVQEDFPRLDERHLPVGVGRVRYELALSACERWRTPVEEVMAVLRA